jgi:hypothetical protein
MAPKTVRLVSIYPEGLGIDSVAFSAMDASYTLRRCGDLPDPHRSTNRPSARWWELGLSHLYSKFTMFPVGLAVANKKQVLAHEILGSPFDTAAQLSKNILSVKTLLSPLSREQIGLARCLGLNYADHAVRNVFVAPVSQHWH